MTTQNKLTTIKQTVQSFLPDARVLLFGSRANGNEDAKSDFDILIITKQTYPPYEKIGWCSKIDKALVKSIQAPVDVLLNSEEEISIKRELPGHIIRWAMKEGVYL